MHRHAQTLLFVENDRQILRIAVPSIAILIGHAHFVVKPGGVRQERRQAAVMGGRQGHPRSGPAMRIEEFSRRFRMQSL